jgi:transposase-like protein
MPEISRSPPAKVLSTYELIQLIPDEQIAITFLEPILWPDGPKCPNYGSIYVTDKKSKKLYHCNDCQEVFTIQVGTVFHRSHVPLHKWIYAMYLMVTARKGISSLQLSKEIGVTQKTAWFPEHRIRTACGNQVEKILSGIVEVDETYIGGIEKNRHASKKIGVGRGPAGKMPVVGMRDRNAQVVAKVANATDSATLQGAVLNLTALGSTVITDEHRSYIDLCATFTHKTVKRTA